MTSLDELTDLAPDGGADRILVTAALPYVNNVPHLGNMVPVVSADVFSRYLTLTGRRSIFICGTDEHGTRTEIEAAKAGIEEDTYCAGLHGRMARVFEWFNVDFTHFGRSSHQHNHELTQRLFTALDDNGYIEPQQIEQLYCDTCSQFLPDTYVIGSCPHCQRPGAKGDQCDGCARLLAPSELLGARCKLCDQSPEMRTSRHLFLKLDALAPHIAAWIEGQAHWDGIIRNMPLGWIAEGMRPRAITRDLKWGVRVPKPGFQEKVFYVWFDAPIGYVSATAEWCDLSGESPDEWWRGGQARLVHFLGKDNVPFHTIIWPATLIGSDLGYNLPDYISANEYLNYEGGAFSKSRQRGIFSEDAVDMGFPADAWRFYLMANRPEKRDTDFDFGAFRTAVNASLVGNFGNLANRLLSFIAKRFQAIPEPGELNRLDQETLEAARAKVDEIDVAYRRIELRAAVRHILALSDIGNGYLQSAEPWATFKNDRGRCETSLFVGCQVLHLLARWAWPIMPERCETLLAMLGTDRDGNVQAGTVIERPSFLFTPIEEEATDTLTERYRGSSGARP